jgi:membrane fusion protein, multidrug efflux system
MSNAETTSHKDALKAPEASQGSNAERFMKTDPLHAKAAPPEVKSGSPIKKVIGGVLAVALIAGAGYMIYQGYTYVSTDNAMVQGKTTLLSSRVSGIIVTANVEENQKVKAGDVLLEIKPEDYKNVVDMNESERISLEAQMQGAETNYKRTLELFGKGASTQERLDAATTQYHSLQAKLKAAEAQVATAQLNLGYTRIVAPADGKIARKSFEVGMLAAAGQPLLGFVEGRDRWVVANLKETDMDDIAVGKKTYVTVDAISGREFEGVVESISPTTGATFSLLPPDNATGNFTKVVQRVPVRIKLLNLDERDIDRLQSGLSAEVKVRIH